MSGRHLPKSILPLSGDRNAKPAAHPDLKNAGPRPLLGVEHVLAMVAADAAFAEALLADPTAAAVAAEVTLTPAQAALLTAVDRGALQEMIAQLAPAVASHDRRAFFSQSAALAVAVLAGGAAVGCKKKPADTGPSADMPSEPLGSPTAMPPPEPAPGHAPVLCPDIRKEPSRT